MCIKKMQRGKGKTDRSEGMWCVQERCFKLQVVCEVKKGECPLKVK